MSDELTGSRVDDQHLSDLGRRLATRRQVLGRAPLVALGLVAFGLGAAKAQAEWTCWVSDCWTCGQNGCVSCENTCMAICADVACSSECAINNSCGKQAAEANGG